MSKLVFILLFSTALASASLPGRSRNGVITIGDSLQSLLDPKNEASLYVRCQNEGRGKRFFSNSCNHLMETLQKKMNLMAIESDVQMQAERLKVTPINEKRNERIAMLAKLNLLSNQAEEAVKSMKNGGIGSDNQEKIPELIPSVEKVRTAYEAYLKLLPNGQN